MCQWVIIFLKETCLPLKVTHFLLWHYLLRYLSFLEHICVLITEIFAARVKMFSLPQPDSMSWIILISARKNLKAECNKGAHVLGALRDPTHDICLQHWLGTSVGGLKPLEVLESNFKSFFVVMMIMKTMIDAACWVLSVLTNSCEKGVNMSIFWKSNLTQRALK